ncbi:uncharacterized protein [Hoplias malabaricus]|uniref:uncharacterized protein n=1 Tax=Hoplias malabaricus TaxID=27720 RepID=UPI003461EEA4
MYVAVCAVLFSLISVGVLGQTVEQPDFLWTKGKNKRAYLKCIVNGLQSDNYVHWYQQKDGEAPRRILYVNQAGNSIVHNSEYPEAKDCTVQKTDNNYENFTQPFELDVDASATGAGAVLLQKDSSGVLGLTVEQSELVWTKGKGKRVRFNCKVTGLSSSDYVHWYQQKDGEGPRRILYVNQAGNSLVPNTDFTAKKSGDNYELRVDEVKLSHSGVYYCAAWDTNHSVLGLTVEQPELVWIKTVGNTARLKCIVNGLQTDYVHWYQQKDGEAPRRILYVKQFTGKSVNNEFTLQKRDDNYELKVDDVKLSHTGVYYCAAWESSHSRPRKHLGSQQYWISPQRHLKTGRDSKTTRKGKEDTQAYNPFGFWNISSGFDLTSLTVFNKPPTDTHRCTLTSTDP